MKIRKIFKSNKKDRIEKTNIQVDAEQIPKEVAAVLENIQSTLGNSSDIITRKFKTGKDGTIDIGIAYTDGLVDKMYVQDFVIEPLMDDLRIAKLDGEVMTSTNLYEAIRDFNLQGGDMKEIADLKTLYTHLLSGDTIVLVAGTIRDLP